MMFFKIINFKIFLLSFILGITFIYLNDSKKKITVYPTLSNKDNIEYKDKADNCFEFKFEKTKCPNESKKINKIPSI
tara:strand:- start:1826 stop:2056 length:231 start_codon:yes stop_codon:yes gene_type:complete